MNKDHKGHKRWQIDFLSLQCCVSNYTIKTKDLFLLCEALALFQQVMCTISQLK